MSDEVDWSDAERQALARLRVPSAAPADVEARLVSELRTRGLLRSPFRRSLQTATAAAVLIAAFASGALLDRGLARRSVPAARFMLLLYGGGGESQGRRSEYAAWARSVAGGGVNIAGEELSTAAEEVRANASSPLPADSLPRGYFIVGVSNLDEARRIASTCPHLQHGGRIVIRAIVAGP
jgi:hypothetical protein